MSLEDRIRQLEIEIAEIKRDMKPFNHAQKDLEGYVSLSETISKLKAYVGMK